LIGSGAWTDAALALIDLELRYGRFAASPMTMASGIARCRASVSCPIGSIVARHADLALAILSAFVDARRAALPASRTSVPTVPRDASPLYEPVYCDNFG